MKNKKEQRTRKLICRLTPVQSNYLKMQADKYQYSTVASYVRSKLFTSPNKLKKTPKELNEIILQLMKIGNNLNQAVHLSHREGIPLDRENTVLKVKKIESLMRDKFGV